MPIKMCT